MSLRAHLWTVALKKKSQNTCVCELFHKKIQNVIILIIRREVITQLIVLVYGSKDASRPCLAKALTVISFGELLDSLCTQLWTSSLKKKHKKRM